MGDDEARAEAEALLAAAGFQMIGITRHAGLWGVGAVDARGVARSGARDDVLSLARDLVALAETEAAVAPAAQPETEGVDPGALYMPDPDSVVGARIAAEEAETAAPDPFEAPWPEDMEDEEIAGEAMDMWPLDDEAEQQKLANFAADADAYLAGRPDHGGMMIAEDLISRRRLSMALAVDAHVETLLAARPLDQAKLTELVNLIMMGLASEAQREEEQRLQRVKNWASAVEETARAVKRSLADADEKLLDAFDPAGIVWPQPPA